MLVWPLLALYPFGQAWSGERVLILLTLTQTWLFDLAPSGGCAYSDLRARTGSMRVALTVGMMVAASVTLERDRIES